MQTGDIKLVRQVNEKYILNLIRTNKIISGADLSDITGLRPSTVLNILNDLSARNYIFKQGKGESTSRGGKRPTLWRLNSGSFFSIGLDIEVSEIKGVILNFDGEILIQISHEISGIKDLSDLIGRINGIINELIISSQINKKNIIGLGIAYAGVVNSDKGLIIKGNLISEINTPLVKELKPFHDFPIKIENNANASAISEKWTGKAQNKKNFMTILLEFDTHIGGIGIGIVIDHKLYHGSSFCAGELNQRLPKMIDLLENIRHNFCQSRFFSAYASSINKININMVINAAKNGDAIAQYLVSHFGNYVGKLIAKSVALINPDTLIISGALAELGKLIVDPIRETVKMEILSIANDPLEIVCSEQGEYSVSIGAASLILNDFFQLPNMYNHE
jgi:predicted NBD/HSP70 family sugar kinase